MQYVLRQISLINLLGTWSGVKLEGLSSFSCINNDAGLNKLMRFLLCYFPIFHLFLKMVMNPYHLKTS